MTEAPFKSYRLGTGIFCFLAVLVWGGSAHGEINVTQHHNHLSRDGLYIDAGFTVSNSAHVTRDLSFSGAVSGLVYAQPLYIEGGPDNRAVVIVVTESNTVYALDATTGNVAWQTNVGPNVAAGSLPCGNISPYGITGTPVVDLPTRSLFFDAIMTVSSSVKHRIFSLNVDTGEINPGWPVDVDSTAAYGGTHFVSTAQGERGALTIVGTNLYVPYGGLAGDCGSYRGWVVGVPISNPAQVMAWATTANGGGAWSVGGLASDGTDIFVATGNTFNASSWSGGEAIVHLPPNLVLGGTSNYWTPTNWSTLDSQDLDIGGTGPLLVTVPGATPSNLVVALGKDGNAYLLNRTNLSGISHPLAQAHVAGASIIQAAATYQTTKGSYVVFANNNNLYSMLITPTAPPTIKMAWTNAENGGGSPFVTSTDGIHNVVVWGLGAGNDEKLHGFDGDIGTNIFTGGGANELMANIRKFNTGIVARGHIYVAGDNKVFAFSVPEPVISPITLVNPVILSNGAFQFSFTNAPGANFYVSASTNLAAPTSTWAPLGLVPEIAPGQYQYADTNAPSNSERYYYVTSP